MMDETAIKNRLVEHGKNLFNAPRELNQFTKVAKADRLLNDLDDHPHAFVLACIMDRQIRAERAWMIPFQFQEKIGDFSMTKLKTLSSADIHRLMSEPESRTDPDFGHKDTNIYEKDSKRGQIKYQL